MRPSFLTGGARTASIAALLLAASGVAAPGSARAFCRATTSPTPADYDPAVSGCWPQGLPVYWASACTSWDVQADASKQVTYDEAVTTLTSAFATWTSSTCPTAAGGTGPVSIATSNLGPVTCDVVEYNQDAPNQHAIIFRDTHWPYDDTSNTLALTTLSYDKNTGEIYDADMEVNTAGYTLSLGTVVTPGGYDFRSIVTHEAGHFLGLAHATETAATMYAHYTPGSDYMRELTADDVAGICSIYSPDGLRHVATAASPTGTLAEVACDPTPRHGFSGECGSSLPPTANTGGGSSCSVARAPGLGGSPRFVAGCALLIAAAFRRRRARSDGHGLRAQRNPRLRLRAVGATPRR